MKKKLPIILLGVILACVLVFGLGHFTRNYTQTVKRAADNKQALCFRQGA
jgi:hypothetical protein